MPVVRVRKNKKGWHEFESYRDEPLKHTTVHEDGALMLTENRVEDKYDAVKKMKRVSRTQ